jgi:SHS2 domain-containing protein
MLARKKLKRKFEILSHPADVKFRIYGKNYEEILKNSLLALKSFWSPKLKKGKIEKEIKISGFDLIDLFISFLSQILSLTYIEKAVFSKIKILEFNLENNSLKAKITGYKFESLKKDIKAITYHQAKLEKTKNRIIFEFIVDI